PSPSPWSALLGFPSSVQAVPAGLLASAGQFGPVPGHISAGSHSPAEARHTVKPDRKPSAGHVVLVPVQLSTSSQGPPAGRHTAPAFPAGCWQASLEPSHSSVLHGLPSSVHAVPAGVLASAGHAVLVPVHVSRGSHSPADARQSAPAWPAACSQASFVPPHRSRLHGLPPPRQSAPLAFLASGPHACPGNPPQPSAMSHSPAAGRQMAPIGRKESGGHVELAPVQTSSGSHASPEPVRQTVPVLPGACWQALFVPSQTSVVHTLPSSVHAVPEGVFASAGQLGPLPGHISAGSHSPAEARQTTTLGSNMSAGHVLLVPVQVSSTSPGAAAARQVVPALPSGC